MTRIELMTFGLSDRCSNLLSYIRLVKTPVGFEPTIMVLQTIAFQISPPLGHEVIFNNNAAHRIRTCKSFPTNCFQDSSLTTRTYGITKKIRTLANTAIVLISMAFITLNYPKIIFNEIINHNILRLINT